MGRVGQEQAMILGWLRLAFFLYLGLTIAYVLTAIYSRSVRREKLEKEWDADPAREGLSQEARTAFIEDGMVHYQKGLKKRLLWLIYVIPTIGFVATICYVNWY
jgi:ABC-type tungstate transport system substrate-binding protein